MLRPVREVAQGRWRFILPHFGIDPRLLSGKQGPCPLCGGKTKFRFDDKDGRGSWICNSSSCGAGDGLRLVELKTGLPFAEVAKRVEEIAGEAPVTPSRPRQSDERQREAVVALWRSSHSVEADDPVGLYLHRRLGEIVVPPTLRFAEACRYQDDVVSYHPAMVARVSNPDGHTVTLHRTYLTRDGLKADVPCPRRNMPGQIPDGSAVRLAPSGPTLGIAEGIENAFAASKLFGVPVWAALNEVMLAKWQAPAGVQQVIVFGDHDAKFVGQASAFALARRVAERGAQARVEIPAVVGQDWNDVLQQQIATGETYSAGWAA